MSKKKESKKGLVFKLANGDSYSLLNEYSKDGVKMFEYKWHECPDINYTIISTKELDSIDIITKITQYRVDRMFS